LLHSHDHRKHGRDANIATKAARRRGQVHIALQDEKMTRIKEGCETYSWLSCSHE
jgi:hypothetical protein